MSQKQLFLGYKLLKKNTSIILWISIYRCLFCIVPYVYKHLCMQVTMNVECMCMCAWIMFPVVRMQVSCFPLRPSPPPGTSGRSASPFTLPKITALFSWHHKSRSVLYVGFRCWSASSHMKSAVWVASSCKSVRRCLSSWGCVHGHMVTPDM